MEKMKVMFGCSTTDRAEQQGEWLNGCVVSARRELAVACIRA